MTVPAASAIAGGVSEAAGEPGCGTASVPGGDAVGGEMVAGAPVVSVAAGAVLRRCAHARRHAPVSACGRAVALRLRSGASSSSSSSICRLFTPTRMSPMRFGAAAGSAEHACRIGSAVACGWATADTGCCGCGAVGVAGVTPPLPPDGRATAASAEGSMCSASRGADRASAASPGKAREPTHASLGARAAPACSSCICCAAAISAPAPGPELVGGPTEASPALTGSCI